MKPIFTKGILAVGLLALFAIFAFASGGFDFSVSLNPTSGMVIQGNGISTTATATLLSGRSKTVAWSTLGCPPNATCSFNPTSGLPTFSSTLAITTSPSTPTGTYTITVRGTSSNGLARTTDYTLTVNPVPFDFSVSLNPTSDSVNQGNSVYTTATATLLSGSSQTVTWSSTGCPTFATCSFNPTSGLPTFSSTFTVSTTGSTPAGRYYINVTGTAGSLSRTAVYTLTVNPSCVRANPIVVITPYSQNGSAGSQLAYTTNVTNTDSPQCGSSTFRLDATIPMNWNGYFASTYLTVSPGASQTTTFYLTSALNATTGNYTFSNRALNLNDSQYYNFGYGEYVVV